MAGLGTSWIEEATGRGARILRADLPVPDALAPDLLPHRELIARWVKPERQSAKRTTLLDEVRQAGIERAEAACDALLREGWIARRERFARGQWEWQSIEWRDLARLQRLLGVQGRGERDAQRQELLAQARKWLQVRAAAADERALAPDLLDEITRALAKIEEDKVLALETLRTRVALLRALTDWHDSGAQGLRRDFALKARGDTKAIGVADWRWLEASVDLDRLRIAQFAPMLWIAGELTLAWGERRLDAGALHCIGLPLADVVRADRASPAPAFYWLVENRASFERQAQSRTAGEVLVWLPGRPSSDWLSAMAHLLRLAPAAGRISADADPAGVDIACTVGCLWAEQGVEWAPYRMGAEELGRTGQQWALNAHDQALLQRLLARGDLHADLRGLCEAMQREGRKAEQEGWL